MLQSSNFNDFLFDEVHKKYFILFIFKLSKEIFI